MFVKCRTVESREPVLVGRKMRRYPVEDDAETDLVRAVDKAGKALRFAESCGRGIEPRRLVPPGGVIGVFGDRQELDMGETHFDAVGDQFVGKLVP
jgi:hypothetical protein